MRWRSLCVSPNALWRFIQKSPIIFGPTCVHPIHACLIWGRKDLGNWLDL
jgi:hypothetical protein